MHADNTRAHCTASHRTHLLSFRRGHVWAGPQRDPARVQHHEHDPRLRLHHRLAYFFCRDDDGVLRRVQVCNAFEDPRVGHPHLNTYPDNREEKTCTGGQRT